MPVKLQGHCWHLKKSEAQTSADIVSACAKSSTAAQAAMNTHSATRISLPSKMCCCAGKSPCQLLTCQRRAWGKISWLIFKVSTASESQGLLRSEHISALRICACGGGTQEGK